MRDAIFAAARPQLIFDRIRIGLCDGFRGGPRDLNFLLVLE
jgi:hypothetical protein